MNRSRRDGVPARLHPYPSLTRFEPSTQTPKSNPAPFCPSPSFLGRRPWQWALGSPSPTFSAEQAREPARSDGPRVSRNYSLHPVLRWQECARSESRSRNPN
ncbi:hypothetical protein OF83DRAFT_793689 [Amylostereum chailletii]|nr:hypothetical protein OF83DRAFT_793689 [Amylostereum chailletii]